MNWKEYEKQIFEYLKSAYNDATITFNQKIKGRYSKRDRQIDVLIESYIAGKKIRLIVDGKYFNKTIDVNDVESFISMVEDVEAKQGILITCKGFSTAAINRAYYGPTDVELDILNFEDLDRFQSLGAIIYSGKHGAIVPAPFGWIIDGTKREGTIATIYQRGLTLELAVEKNEWIYVNILSKDEKIKSLEDFLKFQETNTKIEYPKAKFEYETAIKRTDNAKTLLRTIIIDKYPTNEYTGIIEFDDYFVFFVLFSSIELKSKNIRKLENLIQRTRPIKINEESSLKSRYKNLQFLIDQSLDNEEKADLLIEQAKILINLNNWDEAYSKYDESIKILGTNYDAIKGKIQIGILKKLSQTDLTQLVDKFYDLAPTNPTICHDLSEMFFEHQRIADLIYFLKYGSDKYKENNEAVGNFNYNLALVYAQLERNEEAEQHFLLSKVAFTDSLEHNHYVFKLINQNLKKLRKKKDRPITG